MVKFPEKLPSNHIVVFGSNTEGWHGAGLAKTCMKLYGARYYQGEGRQGDCYAIPTKGPHDTKNKPALQTLTLAEIKVYVDRFLQYAKEHPEFTFLVSPIGCGLAGYRPRQVASLFADAVQLENVRLPKEFEEVLC